MLLAGGARLDTKDERIAGLVTAATENALSVDFAAFSAQVLSFLHPHYRSRYDTSEVWDDVVLSVVRVLEGAPR